MYLSYQPPPESQKVKFLWEPSKNHTNIYYSISLDQTKSLKILSKLQIPDLSGISLLTNKRTIGGVNWDLRHVVALVVALCQWGVENNRTLTKKPPRERTL